MNAVRAVWAALAVLCFACGGESTSDGSGATSGTGATGGSATGGSGGSATGGSGGSATGGSGGSATGGSGGSATGGSGGSATGGSGGTAGSVDCDPDAVLCKSMPPMCNPGEVPSVQGDCWGPCVPILSCNPVADCSTCTKGFCAAYAGLATEYRCVMPSIQCQALACSCLAQYFCVAPYDACVDGSVSKPAVTCECPTC